MSSTSTVAYSETGIVTLFLKLLKTSQVEMEKICAEAKIIESSAYINMYVLYIYIPLSQWNKMVSIIRLFRT